MEHSQDVIPCRILKVFFLSPQHKTIYILISQIKLDHLLCDTCTHRIIESMMGVRPRQGNLRLVVRLYSLVRGLPSIRLK